jgi:hypothetical protein
MINTVEKINSSLKTYTGRIPSLWRG